jgi:hypothetical protein
LSVAGKGSSTAKFSVMGIMLAALPFSGYYLVMHLPAR